MPIGQIIRALFAPGDFTQTRDIPVRICRWHDVSLPERRTISILDARDADDSTPMQIHDELKFQSADVIFFLEEQQAARQLEKRKFDDLITYLVWNNASGGDAKIIGITIPPTGQPIVPDATDIAATRLKSALRSIPMLHEHILEVLSLSLAHGAEPAKTLSREAQKLMSILARNAARSRSGPAKIHYRYLCSNRRSTDSAGRSADSHELTATNGRRNHACERP